MKNWMTRALFATVALWAIAGMWTLLMFPNLDRPWAVRWKIRLIAYGITYGPLGSENDIWDLVLNGVRSGDSEWLNAAASLYLDLGRHTHFGEEMIEAVSTVLDKNPTGALRILLPRYGAAVICGQDEEGQPINRTNAERRALLVKGSPASPEREACLGVVMGILKSGGAG